MVSYTLKAGGDGQLHTERLEEMVSYTLKAGGDGRLHTEGWRDGRLHTEGWRRWPATH